VPHLPSPAHASVWYFIYFIFIFVAVMSPDMPHLPSPAHAAAAWC
jgi:hypothetical protein